VQQEMITPLAVILQNRQYDFFQRTGLKGKPCQSREMPDD
jgi:hypothetical protein